MSFYATRETVQQSLDIKDTARAYAQIDRLIQASSENIDGLTHRETDGYLPQIATRYFDWPNDQSARSWRLWLDEWALAGLPTSVVTGGISLSSNQYFCEPVNSAPPYEWIEINLAGGAAWSAGANTFQRSIAITGPWGYRVDEDAAGALVGGINASVTTLVCSSGALPIGVGALLRIDSERLLVTGRAWNTSGSTAGALGATNGASDVTVVPTGTATFTAGEVILIDAEQMLITDLVGSNLIVKRAWNGTVLASHNAATAIYVQRTLTVGRAQRGTTAASHLDAAPIVRCVPPRLVEQLCIAYTLSAVEQERSAYARVLGSGETAVKWSPAAITALENDVIQIHGRSGRASSI